MPTNDDESAQQIISQLLKDHGLTPESPLFREAERTSLAPMGSPDSYRLTANPHPGESVIDIYAGPGYVVQAEEIGPGLAFAESARPDWQATVEMRTLRARETEREAVEAERVVVQVRVSDILRQGGRMYPVESVEVDRAWYFTLPDGSIEVRLA